MISERHTHLIDIIHEDLPNARPVLEFSSVIDEFGGWTCECRSEDWCAEHLSRQLFRISSFPFHLHWHRVCHDIVVFFRHSISSFNLTLPLIDPAHAKIWTK